MAQQLDDKKVASRQEVQVKIDLKALVDTWVDWTHKKPIQLFQWFAAKADNGAQKMMTGYAAVLTMPWVGIPVRNGARSAFEASKDRWFAASASGVLASIGGAAYVGYSAYGALAETMAVTSFVGKAGAVIGAAVPAAVAMVPAYTAGTLIGASLIGASVAALSLVVASYKNVVPGWNRTVDRFKGVKYDNKWLEEQKQGNVQSRLNSDYVMRAERAVYSLGTDSRKKIWETLNQEFGAAAQGTAAAPEQQVQPAREEIKPMVRGGMEP